MAHEELLNSLSEINELASGRHALRPFVLHRQRHDIGTTRVTERGRRPRRERAALGAHDPHHCTVNQCGYGLSPVVEDL